ncbi:TonB-dependent receptor [Ningiella sp. W23]|uniref:TonB-dependent receptor n=1 Tax=Ningiella sp. W23 TaxID=3023715 RepID=UPI003756813F
MKTKNKCLLAGIGFAVSNTLMAEHIENIEVRGRVNSFLNESEIALNQASSPDMRAQLAVLPGVNVNGNGSISGVLQYRGLFGDRVRINIDGNEIAGAGPNAMDSPLSHVIGSMYQEITLHQGIAPVSVGSETLGGAIEIDEHSFDINQSNTWQHNGGISGGFFHNDHQSVSTLYFGSGNNRYIGLSGDLQEGENYVSGNGREVPSTFYERSAIKLKSGFKNDKHRVDLTLGKRNTNESGTPALAMDIIFVDALWYRINHQFEISDAWQIETQLFGNQNQHDMNNFALRTPRMPQMFRLNDVESEALGIETNLNYQDGGNRFESGIEWFEREQASLITNPNNPNFFINNFNAVERDRFSVFAQYTQKRERFDWQLGLRFSEVFADADDVSTNMAMMNPNVAALQNAFNEANREQNFSLVDTVLKLKFPINEELAVSFSGGIKERAPFYNELYSWFPLGVSAGLADGRNYIGNLDLDKETANKLDLSMQYQAKGFALSGSVFYSNIDNYILGTPSTNPSANAIAVMNGIAPPLQWNNADAKLSGAELRFNAMLSNHWRLMGIFEYVRGKQSSPVEQDLYRLAPASGVLNLAYEGDEWQWHMNYRLVAAQNKVAEQQNETRTGGYAVFDTRFEYALNKDWHVSLLVENLFDREYVDHLAGVNRVSNAEIARGEKLPGAGRNIGIRAQYQF